MSIADKLPAEPLTVTRADFEAVAAKLYEAGMKQGAMDAAKRCAAICVVIDMGSLRAQDAADAIAREFGLGEKQLREALEAAQAWISSAPHGDNCFVSDHYEGDPGNRCNCGKESLESYLDSALSGTEENDHD